MRNKPLLSLTVILLFALFFLAYPIYVIRPFRYQGPRELTAALLVTQYRPVVEVVCGMLAAMVLLSAWRQARKLRRAGLGLLAVLVICCGVLSRINVYEKMFHPLDAPTFSAANESKLDADEQVIAVKINEAARAYPIRDISYHHIVNDNVGGRAIVATY